MRIAVIAAILSPLFGVSGSVALKEAEGANLNARLASFSPDSTGLVISQVFGGGSASGAYCNDFVELFNPTEAAVSLNGWSIQYASAANDFSVSTTKTNLPNVSVNPGRYYLVKTGPTASGACTPLSPDHTGYGNDMSGTAGKVVLVRSQTALACGSSSNRCSTNPAFSQYIVDLVGYGTTASDYEGGGRTPAPSSTTSAKRAGSGCTDTNQNNTDFTTGSPAPRNSSTTANLCSPAAPVQWTSVLNTTGASLAAPGLYFSGSSSQISVGGNGGVLKGFDGASGAELWSQTLGGHIQNRGPIVNIDGTNVNFVTSFDGYVNALNAATGAPYWAPVQIGTNVQAGVAYQPSVPTISGTLSLIFAGTYEDSGPSNRFVALNARTGEQVWAFTATEAGGQLGIIPTTPAVDYAANVVYFGSKDVTGGAGGGHGVWAVDTTQGTPKWSSAASIALGGVANALPSLTTDGTTLYIATVESGPTYKLRALNASNGSERASYTLPDDVRGAPWPHGNDVYVGAGNQVYALTYADGGNGTGTLSTKSGWPAGGVNVPGAGTPLLIPSAPFASVYATANNGYFYRINMDTGAITGRQYLNTITAVSDATYDSVRNAFYVVNYGRLFSIRGDWSGNW